MKKIGILGSGEVARTLGKGFIQQGYAVMLGTRDAGKLQDWAAQAGGQAAVGSFEEAAKYGDILVLAVKGDAAAEVIDLAGPQHFDGKTVIDTTNPIAAVPPVEGVLKMFTGADGSLMEQLQDRFPAIHFVKAFNSVGAPQMVHPKFEAGKPTMFICGNNDAAKNEVKGILEAFDWEVADLGKDVAAGAIEALCVLWCIPGFRENKWGHAFKLLGY